MSVYEEWKDYLTGKEFSNGKIFNYKDLEYGRPRFSALKKILHEKEELKSVIHLGCCDHLPLIDEKIQNNKWLQKILVEHSKCVLGIDIDKEAVEYVKSIGYPDVIYADITKDREQIVGKMHSMLGDEKWDYLIAGEIVEHLDNPTQFLKIIKETYCDVIDKIIITVPNGLSIKCISHAMKGQECINTDHRFWFTPFTIGKVLEQAKIEIEQIIFADSASESELEQLGIENNGVLSSTLVVIGKL